MKRWTVALAAVVLALGPLTVSTAFAWHCVPGAADTPENRERGLCVLHGQPKPRPERTPTPRPTEQPTPAPVVVEVAPPSAPVAPPAAVSAPVSTSSPRHLEQYCHFEPSTQQFEVRLTSDLTEALSQPGNERVAAQDVCNQHVQEVAIVPQVETTAPVVVVPVPETLISTGNAAGGPAPIVEEAVPVETPQSVVEETPPAEVETEEAPPMQMPEALPSTGDGSTYESEAP